MQNKTNIKIIPIFNQIANTKIWQDFAHLELLCDKIKYNYHIDDQDKKRILKNHAQNWAKEDYNFAFAAYDADIMVGFASGYRKNINDMFLRNLYVNPYYNGMGIGSRLLQQSEIAAGLVKQNMTVIPLDAATSFYREHSYADTDSIDMLKKLSPILPTGAIPLFKPILTLRVKSKLDLTKQDKALIKQCKHCPVFVYVTPDNEIDALGVKTPDKQLKIWTNEHNRNMTDFYVQALSNALTHAR